MSLYKQLQRETLELPEDIVKLDELKKQPVKKCKKLSFNSYHSCENYLLHSSFSDEEFNALKIYHCGKCGKWHFTSNGFSKIFKKYRSEIRNANKV